QARSWLENALQNASLVQLRVHEEGGQLSVAGDYPAADKDRWLQIQQAFDSRFGQHIVLTPKVHASAPVHGKRVYPGALLPDNWRLDSIDGDQVRLVRGQERFAFTL
ncbi:hypothetical protein A235_16780, partial [Pseudomonas syringae pv. actinidiae ICMP 19079]